MRIEVQRPAPDDECEECDQPAHAVTLFITRGEPTRKTVLCWWHHQQAYWARQAVRKALRS